MNAGVDATGSTIAQGFARRVRPAFYASRGENEGPLYTFYENRL
jgi:hypothetical protein